MDRQSEKLWTYFIYVALIMTTLAVFWQVHSFGFTNYDDDRYVSRNEHILSGLSLNNCLWAFTSAHFFMWHPVTSLSHMLDCELFGLNPGWHHLINLMFHIANTLLLFTVLKQMTGEFWQSAFVAALFALHPLNVESVAWISERKNVLSTFFWMLTIVSYIRYAARPLLSNYLLVIFVFSLALMSKPTTVALPFVLLLLDYWPLNRFRLKIVPRLIWEKIPLFLLAAGLCVITFVTQKSGDVLKFNEYFPFRVRLANAFASYATYIDKMIYPAQLAAFYPHPGLTLPLWEPIVSFALLTAVSTGILYFGRRKPYLMVGWFWFLGTLIPVIGLVQAGAQAMADRYAYVPLIGLFIIIAWGANDLLTKWQPRKIILSLSAVAIISILSVCTWIQTGYWRNSVCLFEHALKVTGRNYLAYNNLGLVIMEQNRFDEAIGLLRRAVQIDPNYAKAFNNLGMAYSKAGRLQEGIDAFKEAIKIAPDLAEAHNNLGLVYSDLGRYEEAMEACRMAIKVNPDYAEAYYNLGIACDKVGRSRDAVEAFRKAISIKPDYAEVYHNLGLVYDKLSHFQEATDCYKKAIEINPMFADAYNNLGVTLGKLNRYQESIQAFRQAIQLQPNFAEAHLGLGVVYFRSGDKNSAIAEYQILKSLDPQKADLLLNLINK